MTMYSNNGRRYEKLLTYGLPTKICSPMRLAWRRVMHGVTACGLRKADVRRFCVGFLMLTAFPASSLANDACGDPFENAFGPWDYRTATAANIRVVEIHHFTPEIASLRQVTTTPLGGDLSYTLRVFPNHPQALLSLARLALRDKSTSIPYMPYPVECWFDRAARFAPNDPVPPMIAGTYLARLGRTAEALAELDRSASLGDDDANLNYNLGLGYLEAKKYDKAMAHARKAYAAGFPLPGLRDRLTKAGAWKE
jgi:tetratricopeptide (TPR) repeat protein